MSDNFAFAADMFVVSLADLLLCCWGKGHVLDPSMQSPKLNEKHDGVSGCVSLAAMTA